MLTSDEGGSGRRAEVAFVGGFSGVNDVAICDESKKPTGEFFQDGSVHGFSMALNLRLEERGSTEARAATFLIYPWMKRIGLLHLNSYLAVEIGAERYYTRTHSADLPTWGGRFGLGLGWSSSSSGSSAATRRSPAAACGTTRASPGGSACSRCGEALPHSSIDRSLVSRRKSAPTTTVMRETAIGYQSPA